MKRTAYAAAIAIGFGVLASAAHANGPRWSGFYVGGHFGWAWSDVQVTDINGYNGGAGNFGYDADGAFGGGQLGFNWQTGTFVFGVEGDIGYLNLNGEQQFPPYVGVRTPLDSLSSTSGGIYGTITGRFGVTFGNALLYAKGGWGAADVHVSFIDPDPIGTTLVSGTSKSDIVNGWVYGGGLEWAVSNSVSIKAEYLRLDFDDTITVNATSAGGSTFRFAHDIGAIDTVKVGFNIKLGHERPVAPLK